MSVWIVDSYMDSIKERPDSARAETYLGSKILRFPHCFDSLGAARNFLIDRAYRRVAAAEADLKYEKLLLKKCLKNFHSDSVASEEKPRARRRSSAIRA